MSTDVPDYFWPTSRDIVCPKCGSQRGDKCRTLTTGQTTDTHQSRFDAAYDRRSATLRGRYAKPDPAPTTRPHDAEETA